MDNKKCLTRVDIFNLITGEDTEKADVLFEDIFGIGSRYDEFINFCESVKYDVEATSFMFA